MFTFKLYAESKKCTISSFKTVIMIFFYFLINVQNVF